MSKLWVAGALPGWLAASNPAQMALRFQEDQDKLAVKWQSHKQWWAKGTGDHQQECQGYAFTCQQRVPLAISWAEPHQPEPGHSLCLEHLTWWWRDLYCSIFWAVTEFWPQQEKIQQVSCTTGYNHKWILQQTLPAVFTTSAVTHMHFTHFKVILTHHLHLYGSGEIIGSSVVLECHNASVIPFIRTADNANDKRGPLGISLIEAIHRVAVLESGRKRLEFGFQKYRCWFKCYYKDLILNH